MTSRTRRPVLLSSIVTALFFVTCTLSAQQGPPASLPAEQNAPGYLPKFHGDLSRSDSEAAALAYIRVVIRAQHQFTKQYGHFATTLPELVHSGTFTKRMVNPDRGDYTASFKGKKDSYVLAMSPKNLDA